MRLRSSWLVLCALCIGCAGHRSSGNKCAVITDATLGMPVYPACAVDRKARQLPGGAPVMYTPSQPVPCIRAVFDVVVDARGVPIASTAKLVRTNDQGFATAMLAALPSLRYEPAMKDGQPVAQLVQFEPVMVMIRSSSRPTGSDARRASNRC